MSKKRIFVLGLDGMPYTLLNSKLMENNMPNLQKICKKGIFKSMNSVYPVISSVAWTNFSTGKQPAEHNIYGFVDRDENPFSITIPTARDRKEDTIWIKLSKMGKRSIVINVPMTYPPEPIYGKMVSCFLCPDIEKSTYPQEFHERLKDIGYIIDVDTWIVRESRIKFMQEIFYAMKKRFELAFELMDNEQWDYCHIHVMETDRLMHFFWEDIISEDDSYGVINFFRTLDYYIGQLYDRLLTEDKLIILSDHGFCGIKNEVQLNVWLEQECLLRFEDSQEKNLKNYCKESICYSLPPGRIFINLKGREENGTVGEEQYETTRDMIKNKLLKLENPMTGEKIIDKVFFREELYEGPYFSKAADIILHPRNGYDLKSSTECNQVFTNTILNGMHTYDDALIVGINIDVSSVNDISDVSDIIMQEFISN